MVTPILQCREDLRLRNDPTFQGRKCVRALDDVGTPQESNRFFELFIHGYATPDHRRH